MKQQRPLRSPYALPTDLISEYARSRPQSRAMFERAQTSFPGGQTRSVTHYSPFPSVLKRGNGFVLHDADDIEYIDLVNNYTSLIHGNAFEPVTTSVAKGLAGGSAFASVHSAQIELAEKIVARVESIELLRFTNSGSEASALAARIAQRYTGRSELVVAIGGYHGAVPPFSDPSSEPNVRLVPFNDLEALTSVVSERTAAVFLEPFQGAGGVIPGTPEYLHHAAQVSRQAGALFVLDEVQSLRNSVGGAQNSLGITPDLTLLGKIIGGGFPIGAVGGRADVLDTTSPYSPNPMAHAGTFNGHIASVIAGAVTLDLLDHDTITNLNRRAARLQVVIEDAACRSGLAISVTRAGSILNVYVGDAPATSTEAAQQPAFHAALHIALLLEGVYTATRGMVNLSTVIPDEVIEDLGRRYQAAFSRLAQYSTAKWKETFDHGTFR